MFDLQHMLSVVHRTINWISARPLQHRLVQHLLDETQAHYGNLILRTSWQYRGKVLLWLQEILSEIVEFLLDRSDLPPQLQDYQCLLVLTFLKDFTAELNEFNTDLQSEDKAIVKMVGTTDAFRGKLKM